MVLPLLWRTPGGEAAIADSTIMSWLGRLREDLSLVPSGQFRRLVRSTLGAAAYDGFMRLLGDGSVVPVQTSDSVWALIDASFALAARVREGIGIRGPGGRLRRGIALDIELWSVPQRQVVWRAVAELAAFDSPVSDRRLLSKVYGSCPLFSRAQTRLSGKAKRRHDRTCSLRRRQPGERRLRGHRLGCLSEDG
jgi:hypothetical protein